MSDILERILATKRRDVEAARARFPLAEVEARARAATPARGFAKALRRKVSAGRPAVIAEIKRASPSRGVMREDFDPARFAASYERHGAACLSVLTDREFFGGSEADLKAARAACSLPVLRKDFIVDPWQVFESRAMGADCILLIIGAVAESALHELEAAALVAGVDVLLECHDAAQLETALRLKSPLIGVNNRDLRTFEIRLENTLELSPKVPENRLLIAESGISEPGDVQRLKQGGVSAYLVGSAFMTASDPGEALSSLFQGP